MQKHFCIERSVRNERKEEMKETAYKCDVCGKVLSGDVIDKANVFVFDRETGKQRSKTYHFCHECFKNRFCDLTGEEIEKPTEKQLTYIKSIERAVPARFRGKTKLYASNFIRRYKDALKQSGASPEDGKDE